MPGLSGKALPLPPDPGTNSRAHGKNRSSVFHSKWLREFANNSAKIGASYFAVFLCVLAPLRETGAEKSHFTPRRKGAKTRKDKRGHYRKDFSFALDLSLLVL